MYYGGWGHCNVVRLNNNFTGLLPFADGTYYKEITPPGYVEGPFMLKKNGTYYFMWSEGGWTGPDYKVAYGRGSSPTGPFVKEGIILEQDPFIATGAGHHSVFQVRNRIKMCLFWKLIRNLIPGSGWIRLLHCLSSATT